MRPSRTLSCSRVVANRIVFITPHYYNWESPLEAFYSRNRDSPARLHSCPSHFPDAPVLQLATFQHYEVQMPLLARTSFSPAQRQLELKLPTRRFFLNAETAHHDFKAYYAILDCAEWRVCVFV